VSVLSLDALVASSESLGSALRGIERAAASDAAVLIAGEPGTGRSLLARLLHQAGPRAAGPLVEADLAAIPTELFESELFGHRAGAFTGARGDSPGRAGRADGGTLVLDHLEEIPLAAQPALLRLVAEKRFTPLGGAERAADLRVISIASTDLRDRVERGAFREDLYYRLEVLTFLLPPLRRRRADLEHLVDATLADLCTRMGRDVPELGAASREWMGDYSWPGNLRQLRNVLERSLVLADGGSLEVPAPADLEPRPRTLEEVEREEIRRALRYTRGHQGRAADLLGISRKTLWEKRRRYGLP
jgi:DNA-binding NtrC family response regulator